MKITSTDTLAIYELDGERVVAADTDAGRALASEVLGGSRAEADAAQPTGLVPGQLDADQTAHLAQHGWC